MIPGSQPSRPKPPQQSPQTTYAHQLRRTTNSIPTPSISSQQSTSNRDQTRPRNQIEAMPPTHSPQRNPPPSFDSAVRHPVFFTHNLKKPPFAIPQIASQGWSPVASGYIMEQQRTLSGNPRNKL